MHIAVLIAYDLSDPEEQSAMADPLASILGFLASKGATTEVRSPAPSEIAVSIPESALVPASQPSPLKKRGRPPANAARKMVNPQPPSAAPPQPAPDEGDSVPETETDDIAADDDDPFDAIDPPAAPEPQRSPEDAKTRALALLRHVYTRPGGGADAVKKLQKTRRVTKFSDVPVDDASALLAEAEVLARDFKVSLPG